MPEIVPMGYPFQYVLVNGMPYLMQLPYNYQQPYGFHPHHQGAYAHAHQMAQTVPLPPQQPDREAIALRNQRRAAALWLIMKLVFLVYIFSQKASIERVILLHVVALVIFLYQTGRLRFVRRRRYVQGYANVQGQGVPQQAQQAQQAPLQPQHNAAPQQAPNDAAPASGASSSSTAASQQPNNSNPNDRAAGASTPAATTGAAAHANVNDEPNNAAAENPPPMRQTILRDIERALLMFFTSLVPVNPPEAVAQDEVVGG